MFWGRGRCPRQCPGSRLADTPGSCPPFLLIPPKALPLGMPNSHSLPLGTQNTALGGSQPAFQPRSSCVPCLCAIIWSKATPSDCPSLPPPQDSSLPKIIPAGTTLTPEADLESVKTLSSEAQRLQHGILPPLSTERWARGRVPAALPAGHRGMPARSGWGCWGEMGQEPRGGGGAGLGRGLPGSLSLPANSSPLARGWALCGTGWVIRCPSSSANPSEANHAFKTSPRAWQAKSSSVPTPPPIQIGHLVTQEVSTER